MHFFELIWQRLNVCQRLAKRTSGGTTVEGPPLISCYGCVSFYDSGNARLIALSPVKLAFVNWTTTMNSSHEVLS